MKRDLKILLAFACMLFTIPVLAQNVAINTDGSLADTNAILDIKSTNKGILIPRMSSAMRLSIPATKGLLVFDTITNSFWYHTGAIWQNLGVTSNSWLLTGR